jgi:23S rRNA (cytidine1920-2'-O)/16S rRNA (cytidine1409-2'-O)-methyltransferase
VAKKRLDLLLVESGLVESREKAQALILSGEVLVNGQVARRASLPVPEGASVEVRQQLPYVSRGGLKLAHALDRLGLDVRGLTIVDVGASTGGFTDCVLQRGARRVYAVDVGYGQLDYRLRQDPRVVVLERTNIRELAGLPEMMDAAVIDVSFISLTLVLPVVTHLLSPQGWVLALVKPQFEAGREQVGKGGVVRDPAVHRRVLEKVAVWAQEHGLAVAGAVASPILGPAGNREFFELLRLRGESVDVSAAIEQALRSDQASSA